MSFARYALDSIVRNRRRTLYAVLGIALAVSLIAGSLIAVDSASLGLVKERLDGIPVDYYGQSYNSYPTEIDLDRYERVTGELLEVDGVESASCVLTVQGFAFYNTEGDRYLDDDYGWYPSGFIFMLPEDPSVLTDRYGIEGDAPDPGTVALPEGIAETLGIEPGEDVVCSYETYDYDYVNGTTVTKYLNISFEVSQVWGQSAEIEEQAGDWYWGGRQDSDITLIQHRNPVVMSVSDHEMLTGAFTYYPFPGFSERYLVWIDRGEFVHLSNIALSIESLETLNGRLERAAREADVGFYTALTSVLYEMGGDMNEKKVVFLALSLPVIAMGIYLSLVGVEMGMTDRRRELGVLKSRGASSRQVFTSLFLESLLLGGFASLLGLGIGFVLSRFLVVAVSGLFFSETAGADLTMFFVSSWTVATVLFFGIALMLASSYRSMKRAARMPVAEALHYYTPKTVQLRYKAKYDVAALALSVWSIVSVLWARDWFPDWNSGSYLMYLFLTVMILIGWVMVPVVPFLLSVSTVRLVTRGSRKLYTRFSWLVRSWTKELHYIVEKNIARNPKRASNIGIIVSLAVAFGLFVSVTMESELAYAEKVVLYEVGADLKYGGYPFWTVDGAGAVDYEVLESVETVDGIERAALFVTVSAQADYRYATMAIFDSEEITEVLDIGSGWYAGDGSDDIHDLKEDGTAFVSELFAEDNYIEVGDTVPASVEVVDDATNQTMIAVDFQLRVIGLVSQLPGLRSEVYIDFDTMSFIELGSLPSWSTQVGIFADVEDGADHYETADRLRSFCYDANLDGWVEIAQQRLDEAAGTPAFKSIRDFLYLEYALSLVMLTCGVGLVLFVTVWDRRQELACIMARGSSAEQMRRILMGESVSLMALGMTVGASTGLLSAYLYNRLIYVTSSSEVPHDTVISWVTWAVLLSAVVSFMAASYLATHNVGRLKLAEILRIRGG